MTQRSADTTRRTGRREGSGAPRPLPEDYGRDDRGGRWGGEVGYGYGGEDRPYGTGPHKDPGKAPDPDGGGPPPPFSRPARTLR